MLKTLAEWLEKRKLEKRKKIREKAWNKVHKVYLGNQDKKNYNEKHSDYMYYIECIYLELSDQFNQLGYLHEGDKDLTLHREYYHKGIIYYNKWRELMSLAYLNGIYENTHILEWIETYEVSLKEARELINNYELRDELYREMHLTDEQLDD